MELAKNVNRRQCGAAIHVEQFTYFCLLNAGHTGEHRTVTSSDASHVDDSDLEALLADGEPLTWS